jgi:transposase InsO family protein
MMPLQGGLSVELMCSLGGVSRATFYRHLRGRMPRTADMEARHEIQKISLAHRRYGYRRVCKTLRHRGLVMNHKKVLRLMRQDNLLAIRKRKFVVTTESGHARPVFSNYAQHIKVDRPNQLWVADITYIRLRYEFVYLAVVLDVFSRSVVGWALGRSLQALLAVKALESAIAHRQPPPGLVHHSDRGVQYASEEYIRLLERFRMLGSMSRPGCPFDNAFCESFMRTLKQEEVYCSRYTGMEDLEAHLTEFIDNYYNVRRLHSALGYCPPLSYEQQYAAKTAGATIPDISV